MRDALAGQPAPELRRIPSGRSEQEAVAHLPALEPVLARVREAAEGLSCATLAGPAGQQAMAALARRYLDIARYPEAAIVLREALVSRHAPGPQAVEGNCSSSTCPWTCPQRPTARSSVPAIWSATVRAWNRFG